jgi:WhiB family transcriptional regulator, redox-sensing transcriptional regulator
MVATGNWRVSGNCRNGDPERLFVTGAKQREARTICRGCPVLVQCLSHALDERIEFGVWGGMTERERRAMLKARPDVRCWASFLAEVAARRATGKAAARSQSARKAAARVTVTAPVVLPTPVPSAPAERAAPVQRGVPSGLSDGLSDAA